jgi:hypothetical protein
LFLVIDPPKPEALRSIMFPGTADRVEHWTQHHQDDRRYAPVRW